MEKVPLLQAFWADVETATPTESGQGSWPTATEIRQRYPNQFIQHLKLHGIQKLGETRIAATDLPALFGGDVLLTRGSESCKLDWASDWGIQPVEEPTVPEGVAEADTQRVCSRITSSRGGWLRQQWHSRRYSRGPRDAWGLGRCSAPALSLSYPFAVSEAAEEAAPQPASCTPGDLPPPPSVVVESYLVAVRDAAAPGDAGLLRPLLRRWQLGSCSAAAFGLPAVQAVVSYKWSRFARRLLLQQLAAYGLWLGSFTVFMILFNSSDASITSAQLLSTMQGRAAVVFEALALLGMLPFVVGEVCVVAAYGVVAWLSAWNLLDCATYVLQVVITVLHLGMSTDGPFWLTIAVAVQAILLVVRLTFFSRVFKSTTFDFMGSLQAVLGEVGWYVAVLVLLMWGFACAFFTIFRDDGQMQHSFKSLPVSLLTMLNYAVGGTSYYMRDLMASTQPYAAILLCITYEFLVSMLLMSLLTGVMTNALMKTSEQEAVAMVLNRAQVIDELETVLPPPLLRLAITSCSDSVCHTSCRPVVRHPQPGACRGRDGSGPAAATAGEYWMPYIHVLRVNPSSLERIDGEEKLWPAMSAATSSGALDGLAGASPRGASATAAGAGTSHAAARGGGGGGGDLLYGSRGGRGGAAAGATQDTRAVARLEAHVRQLEGQVADLQGVVRQLLELKDDVRQVLDVVRHEGQRQQQQQLSATPASAAPASEQPQPQ